MKFTLIFCCLAIMIVIGIQIIRKKLPKRQRIQASRLSPFWFILYIGIGSVILILLVAHIIDSLHTLQNFVPPE
ncbi:MAG TPA: hypothetical protein DDX71_01520 [Ruminococcus sp.]|nr:hypothetical protein [Ruminococcus sp.]